MTQLSRRTVLTTTGTVALAAALGPVFAQAAHAAPTLTPADLETLRTRWVDDLTSRDIIVSSPATFATQIATLDRGVDRRLAAIAPTPTRYFRDRDWSVGATLIVQSNNMRLNYVDLQTMAVAWATPMSRHEGSPAVLNAVREGLAHMHTHVYNPQTEWFGNWWSWLIGATRPLADIMAILQPVLDQAEIDAYCASMDHFLPNRDPQLQIHPNGVQLSEGANRVDICRAFIVRAIVQPDTDLLTRSIAALSPTWQYVTEGNGFFADGSFIQHSTIGYTGTYGLVLLDGLARLFALLAGTTFDISDPTRVNLTRAVEESFAPFMFQGQMMDAVRGRAVARIQERSIDNGNQFIEVVLRLARAVDETTATRWRGLARQWIESNEAATILDTTNIGRLALVTELLSSSVAPVPDPVGPRFFPAMDRLVYRGADGQWALTVAMSSNRIAWHEGTEAENFLGVKTSQGMTYLYLGDDDDHFDDEFWATSDLAAPAGTTVDLTELPPNPEGTWGSDTPDNEWTGGVTFDQYALASMHLVAPGGTGLEARKSWFCLPDRVVALGADISTQSQAAVETVVEHRNLGTEGRTLLLDGDEVTDETRRHGPRWAHLEGVAGYVFLSPDASIRASVGDRSGAWARNSTGNQAGIDTVHTRRYATLAWEHGVGAYVAGATYAYLLLPRADIDTTRAAVRSSGVIVLRNDAVAQAVQLQANVTAAAFWQPGRVGPVTAEVPLCFIGRVTRTVANIRVSDPTQGQDSVRFSLTGMPFRRVGGPDRDRVQVRRSRNGLDVTVDVRGRGGLGVDFTIQR